MPSLQYTSKKNPNKPYILLLSLSWVTHWKLQNFSQSKILLWLKIFDKHIWYFGFPSDRLKRCIQFQDRLKVRFTALIPTECLIPQVSYRELYFSVWLQDLPSFTFSSSRNSWGRAVVVFLQGWSVHRNEPLSLNNLAWNAIYFPSSSFASCLLLPPCSKCSKAFSFVCVVLTRWFFPAQNFQPRLTNGCQAAGSLSCLKLSGIH